MLRDVRSSFLAPRLIGLKYTTASNAVTIGEGVGSASITSAGTGQGVIAFRRAFARRPIVVASPSSADIAAGGYVITGTNTYPAATGLTVTTANSSVSADDGTCYMLALGYDQRDGTRYSRRSNVVRGEVDQGKIVALRIDTSKTTLATGITINNRAGFIWTRNGTGDVTITLRSAFAHTSFVAVGTAVSATGQQVMTDVTASNTVRVKVFTNGGTTPADGIVNLICYGDAQGPGERAVGNPLMNDQRRPQLFGYSIIYTSGVPTYDFNSGDATLAATATGRVTFTHRQAYRREPIVVALPIFNIATQCCTIDNSSSTAFEVKNFSSGNALADCANGGGFQLIGIGWDDPSEY